MNKKELIAEVSERTGFTKKNIEATFDEILTVIEEVLSRGEEVDIFKFCKFKMAERAEKTGRNPSTKEEIKIPAKSVPVCKLSDVVKKKLTKIL